MFIDHVIQEAQNYEQMFNDIFKLNPDPRMRQQISQDIDWARKRLRKNDRIVWFLRWLKVWLSSTGSGSGITGTSAPNAFQHMNRRLGTAHGQGDIVPPPILKQRLGHFPSLPVPENKNHVLRTEMPRPAF